MNRDNKISGALNISSKPWNNNNPTLQISSLLPTQRKDKAFWKDHKDSQTLWVSLIGENTDELIDPN